MAEVTAVMYARVFFQNTFQAAVDLSPLRETRKHTAVGHELNPTKRSCLLALHDNVVDEKFVQRAAHSVAGFVAA